jgi:putative hydrolase of the HAD superfamily
MNRGRAAPPPVLVFDVGQVLLGWQPLALLQAVVPRHAPDEARARQVKEALFGAGFTGGEWSRFDRGRIEPAELVAALAARLGWAAAEVTAVVDAIAPALAPHPPLVDALHELAARGHALFFLSNMPAPYADWLEARHRWFVELFRGGLWSGREHLAKPEPAFYRRLAAHPGFDAAAAVHFFDDHAPNLPPAAALGWQPHQVDSPQALLARLKALGFVG